MEDLLKIASQYGILGLITLASYWFILYKEKQHTEERKEMRQALKEQHEEALEVTRNNTTVLTEISTLIKHKFK